MLTATTPLSTSSPFVSYTYAYPHKSAYRELSPAVPLEIAWRDEQQDALFLYLHVPFCEYRCGFCNLFTLANADGDLAAAYLQQLRRQAMEVRDALPGSRFARFAIGGGTPTYLDERQLADLFDIAQDLLNTDLRSIPVSCEASPATITSSKLQLLHGRGVDRLSLGVQAFDDNILRCLGRPQKATEARRAVEMVKSAGFPTLNLDLIYGVSTQSTKSWSETVRTAVEYSPEEVFLYPLYVRQLTGLHKIGATALENRLDYYRLARDILLGSGYEQVSLRMFRLPGAPSEGVPAYCCQSDGMIGVGCGARSYTRQLHYSAEFAVSRSGVSSILNQYLRKPADAFRQATFGYRLDKVDQVRRFTILGLLQVGGLSLHSFRRQFSSDPLDALPHLRELLEHGLADLDGERLRLTEQGIELSDAIGPWLYSNRVRRRMEEHECR